MKIKASSYLSKAEQDLLKKEIPNCIKLVELVDAKTRKLQWLRKKKRTIKLNGDPHITISMYTAKIKVDKYIIHPPRGKGLKLSGLKFALANNASSFPHNICLDIGMRFYFGEFTSNVYTHLSASRRLTPHISKSHCLDQMHEYSPDQFIFLLPSLVSHVSFWELIGTSVGALPSLNDDYCTDINKNQTYEFTPDQIHRLQKKRRV